MTGERRNRSRRIVNTPPEVIEYARKVLGNLLSSAFDGGRQRCAPVRKEMCVAPPAGSVACLIAFAPDGRACPTRSTNPMKP
jgi:hypothetical protein